MKSVLALLVALTLLVGIGVVGAAEVTETYQSYAESSGDITTSKPVVKRAGALSDVAVTADGTTKCSIILYDNASTAAGTIIWRQTVTAGIDFGGALFTYPKKFTNGIYVDRTTTGTCTVNLGWLLK